MENDRRRTAVAAIALAATMAVIVAMFLTLKTVDGRRAPRHNGIGQAASAIRPSTGRASAVTVPESVSAPLGLRRSWLWCSRTISADCIRHRFEIIDQSGNETSCHPRQRSVSSPWAAAT